MKSNPAIPVVKLQRIASDCSAAWGSAARLAVTNVAAMPSWPPPRDGATLNPALRLLYTYGPDADRHAHGGEIIRPRVSGLTAPRIGWLESMHVIRHRFIATRSRHPDRDDCLLRAENEKLRETLKGALYGAHRKGDMPMKGNWRSGLAICRHIPSNPNRTARQEEGRLCRSLSGRRPPAQHRRRRQDQRTKSHRRCAGPNVRSSRTSRRPRLNSSAPLVCAISAPAGPASLLTPWRPARCFSRSSSCGRSHGCLYRTA